MKILLEHQQRSYNTFADKELNVGEDAKPYADEKLILVADGLGGRGGFPHTELARGMLEKDRLVDVAFSPVFDLEGEKYEDLKKFIQESFSDLFALKEIYGRDFYSSKGSGYFASHLIAAIALYLLRFDARFDIDALFENCEKAKARAQIKEMGAKKEGEKAPPPPANAESEDKNAESKTQIEANKAKSETENAVEKAENAPVKAENTVENAESAPAKAESALSKEELLKKFALDFSAALKEKLAAIAQNAGLKNESRLKGTYLLPTTLSVTLMREREESVDLICLWAGDSRAYYWNEEGLAQISDDHEIGGTMTNLISLAKDFRLQICSLKVKKPCLVFNATDGVYKCMMFASPLDLESLLLQAILKSESVEQLEENLDKIYENIGRHDDSNSLAAVTFGYADLGALKAAARKRSDEIERKIVSRLPGILTRDYRAEYEKADAEFISSLLKVKDQAIAVPEVLAAITRQMKERKYAPFEKEVAEIKGKIRKKELEIRDCRKEISSKVALHWIKKPTLRKLSGKDLPLFKKGLYKKVEGIDELKKAYASGCDEEIDELQKQVEKFCECGDKLRDVITVKDTAQAAEESLERIEEVVKKLKARARGKNEIYKQYFSDLEDIEKVSEEMMQEDEAEIEKLAEEIFSGKRTLGGTSGELEAEMSAILAKKTEAEAEISALNGRLKEIEKPYAERFWNEFTRELIVTDECRAAIEKHEELTEAAKAGEAEKKRAELEVLLEKRQELYAEYEKNYQRSLVRSDICLR